MIKHINWNELTIDQQNNVLKRPIQHQQIEIISGAKKIIDEVRNYGDLALKKLTKRFDKISLDNFHVTSQEFELSEKIINEKEKSVIQQAAKNIIAFHEAQFPQPIKVMTTPGVFCEKQSRPIQSVGLYVPGGNAPLISTVLMLAIPSRIAVCKRRILCTPPRIDGTIAPHILYAAKYCGINEIYKIGGAQAIAAMAYGTETIPKVDKIFGPGNAWVTQAKLLVAQDPSGALSDIPAGPSELMVIADESADPVFVAADLLSQAEHGMDSQVIFLTTSLKIIEEVSEELQKQLAQLSRKKIAEAALKNSYLIVIENVDQAIEVANRYAPEHLIINANNPRQYIEKIRAAGSVFLGAWAPESVGDYASGTNHVLPTYGYARATSGLSVSDFMTQISFQELTRKGLNNISEIVMALAEMEGLTAHRNAVAIRLLEEK